MKQGNQRLAGREQVSTSFMPWRQPQNSLIFLELLQKSENGQIDFYTKT